MTTWSARLTF